MQLKMLQSLRIVIPTLPILRRSYPELPRLPPSILLSNQVLTLQAQLLTWRTPIETYQPHLGQAVGTRLTQDTLNNSPRTGRQNLVYQLTHTTPDVTHLVMLSHRPMGLATSPQHFSIQEARIHRELGIPLRHPTMYTREEDFTSPQLELLMHLAIRSPAVPFQDGHMGSTTQGMQLETSLQDSVDQEELYPMDLPDLVPPPRQYQRYSLPEHPHHSETVHNPLAAPLAHRHLRPSESQEEHHHPAALPAALADPAEHPVQHRTQAADDPLDHLADPRHPAAHHLLRHLPQRLVTLPLGLQNLILDSIEHSIGRRISTHGGRILVLQVVHMVLNNYSGIASILWRDQVRTSLIANRHGFIRSSARL